jgi:hypothetical protein
MFKLDIQLLSTHSLGLLALVASSVSQLFVGDGLSCGVYDLGVRDQMAPRRVVDTEVQPGTHGTTEVEIRTDCFQRLKCFDFVASLLVDEHERNVRIWWNLHVVLAQRFASVGRASLAAEGSVGVVDCGIADLDLVGQAEKIDVIADLERKV